jgi:hypothetical protein
VDLHLLGVWKENFTILLYLLFYKITCVCCIANGFIVFDFGFIGWMHVVRFLGVSREGS